MRIVIGLGEKNILQNTIHYDAVVSCNVAKINSIYHNRKLNTKMKTIMSAWIYFVWKKFGVLLFYEKYIPGVPLQSPPVPDSQCLFPHSSKMTRLPSFSITINWGVEFVKDVPISSLL